METAAWPNHPYWKALADGERFTVNDHPFALSVVDCGPLVLPSGRLVVCDPFAMMQQRGNQEVQIPAGAYPVRVTVADVSAEQDGSHLREAYASLILAFTPEVERGFLAPVPPGATAPALGPDEFVGVGVDAGAVCFVDAAALEYGMPDRGAWLGDLFDDGTPDSWFGRMDDPAHIRDGIANIPLPLATDGANLVLFHSGWGDGSYPVIGGYDAEGTLVAVHVDFFVIPDPDAPTPA